jgi:WD40 repeat protein
LTGIDFSNLTIWQAYLQGTILQRTNFTNADLRHCVFNEAFDRVKTVAFSPDGTQLATGDSRGDILLSKIESLSLDTIRSSQMLLTFSELPAMPAKDVFHQLVKTALENEGWTITHDPYHIDLGFVDFYIDLGAERLIAATKGGEKIAVEIKTFLAASTISEFHTSIGQFINYRIALEEEDADRKLYLAVPSDIYKRFFKHPFIQTVICRNQIPLLVYDTEKQEIAQWIS